MNKKMLSALIVIVIIALGATAAFVATNHKGSSTPTASSAKTTATQPTATTELTIDSAATKLQAAGLTVGNKDTAYFQTIGAVSGNKIVVNGSTTVELYQFKDDKAQTTAKTQLAASGTIIESGHTLVLIDSTDGTGNPTDAALATKIKNALE